MLMTRTIDHYGPGRPLADITRKHMDRMLNDIRKDPGIASVLLGKRIGVSSHRASVLGKKLVKKGLVTKGYNQNGGLVYFPVEE